MLAAAPSSQWMGPCLAGFGASRCSWSTTMVATSRLEARPAWVSDSVLARSTSLMPGWLLMGCPLLSSNDVERLWMSMRVDAV